MVTENYYQILGVSYHADESEIKKAYRRLAKKYHPDSDGKNKEMFQKIAEAYRVLSDPKLRQQYRYMGHEAFRKSHGRNSFYYQYTYSYEEKEEDCSGCGSCGGHDHSGRSSHSHTKEGHCGSCGEGRTREEEPDEIPPSSIRAAVHLTMEETLREVVKEITIQYQEECPCCHGSRKEPGTGGKVCPECMGHGRNMVYANARYDSGRREETCRTCQGTGEIPEKACHKCGGRGYIMVSQKVKVKIPPNSCPGQFYFFQDIVCEPGFDKELRNLFVIVLIDEHPHFERRDYHIHASMSVDFVTMTLGGEIKVTTLEGIVPYTLAPGTEAGTRIRLAGKGLPAPKKTGGGRGDIYVTLQVGIPKTLSPKQKEALLTFGKYMDK